MKYSALVLIFFTCLGSNAQGVLNFEVSHHDFGQIEEANGPVTYSFAFKNTGIDPISILKVKASCGCTVPAWTKGEVLPGDSGIVTAKYNPFNRPGRFNKTLTITASDPKQNQTLKISGYVKPKPKSPAEEYPISFGSFKVKNRYVNFGKINTKEPVKKFIDAYNGSDSTVILTKKDLMIPPYISMRLLPEELKADTLGKIEITYDPAKKNDFGYVSDNVQLGEHALSIIATIEEYFPEMTPEELDEAPRLEISDRSIDIGNITQGELVDRQIILENVGRKKLSIRKIKSNCDCLTYKPIAKNLKKGKSASLEVTLNTSDLKGNQYKTIAIFSNDPVSPSQIITLKGRVEEK